MGTIRGTADVRGGLGAHCGACGQEVNKVPLPESVQNMLAARIDRLAPREKQVLQLIAQGQSNKDIAQLLGLSVNTVSVHRANLMEALKMHKTAELVLYAIRKGLVTPP